MNDHTIPLDELTARLRSWARGSYSTEAAVELLVAHTSWMQRSDFLTAVWIEDDLAGVDWELVRATTAVTAASGGERRLLELILGLAGEPSIEPLASLLTGLDATNVALVLNAIARCAGWADRRLEATITGRFDMGASPAARPRR
jgi:hypothetical protein